MARRRRRSGDTTSQFVAVILLAAALVAAVGAILFFYFKAQDAFVALDADSLCPESGVTAQTIVLLDTTDDLARATQSEVLNRLDDLTAGLPRGGLLDIRVLDQDPDKTKSVLTLCNPGSGADIDPLIGNVDLAKKRWATRFAGPVQDALAASVSGGSQDFSPILAALQQIAADRLSTTAQKSITTRIVVVSDMLEHTDHYSHFRDGTELETYKEKVGQRYLTDLAGAEIDFWLVVRDRPDIDVTALAEFWLQWADISHGRGAVVRLMGME